ncbi:hypothetical protein AZL_014150 [Azospirillum sp. B510]|uniref:hypothetical protein n=1 Tax=Azospirillum sp. (strain B510) TaxID=137722 RepID=UPI0001C4C405|nr:hypothetical protein [Azospirillum sp. B510]BAI72053.1 hypothetical protein AZL_014150 [Azospirillum sp. B510]
MAPRRAEPSILLGPILYFRGEQRDRWWLSALFVLDGDVEPDDLRVDGVTLPVPPRHLMVWRRRHVWRFDFAVPRAMRDTDVVYGFPDGPRWSVVVPGRHSLPRMAILYGSGIMGGAGPDAESSAALWPQLTARHSTDRYHLLVQAGGQVDGNAVMASSPQANALLSDASRRLGPALPGVAEELMGAGFDRMLRSWSGAGAALALASIPSVMMWDGADLGRLLAGAWGDREEGDATSRSLRPLMMAVRRQTQLFQTGSVADAPPDCLWGSACGTLAQGFVMGESGLLTLDLWSDRNGRRMLSERGWSAFADWLDRFTDCRHLILVSGAPLLSPASALPGRWGGILPLRLRSRLGDHWSAPGRHADWERMVRMLADFSRRSGCRVTIASRGLGGIAGRPGGESGARGVLRGGGLEMWQLHAPPFSAAGRPEGWVSRLAEPLFIRPDHPLPGHRFEMPPFAEDGRRLLHGPGWIACSFDAKGQLHVGWCRPDDGGRHVQAI